MGWFWADTTPLSRSLAPHPRSSTTNKNPPVDHRCTLFSQRPDADNSKPGCPMHESPNKPAFPPQQSSQPPTDGSSCPVAAPNAPVSTSEADPPSTLSKLNPLNYMPSNLSHARASNQTIALPTARTTSSIPRDDTASNWEYPSPQQMYNAMLRKGYDDTPEDAVESMVAVHNFLNEGAWAEIEGWEARFSRGLGHGWKICRNGEERFMQPKIPEDEKPRLARFMGRPGDRTPKATMLDMLGRAWPSQFAGQPPFDRHDWYVRRTLPGGYTREIRYVIDYYSGPPEPTGEPVFYLDVRPAVDGPTAAAERMVRWGGDVWHRAKGAKLPENSS